MENDHPQGSSDTIKIFYNHFFHLVAIFCLNYIYKNVTNKELNDKLNEGSDDDEGEIDSDFDEAELDDIDEIDAEESDDEDNRVEESQSNGKKAKRAKNLREVRDNKKKKFNNRKPQRKPPTKIVYETETERNTSSKKKENVKHFQKLNSFNKKLTF